MYRMSEGMYEIAALLQGELLEMAACGDVAVVLRAD